jgi:hypothetical protein
MENLCRKLSFLKMKIFFLLSIFTFNVCASDIITPQIDPNDLEIFVWDAIANDCASLCLKDSTRENVNWFLNGSRTPISKTPSMTLDDFLYMACIFGMGIIAGMGLESWIRDAGKWKGEL